MKKIFTVTLLTILVFTEIKSQEWPQFQRDAARTGRTSIEIPPPYRVRWIWLGNNLTLRNQNSEPGWPDNLTSQPGYSLPIPDSVNYTISQQVQPVISDGKVFFGTQEGEVYAVSAFDGSIMWQSTIEGGILVSSAVGEGIVVFAGLMGKVKAFDVTNGNLIWTFDIKSACTTAPCILGNRVLVAFHNGKVCCFDLQTGNLNWTQTLTAPVTGGIASNGATVYVPAEDMKVFALNVSDGSVKAQNRVKGQGFRMTHLVVFGKYVWVTSALTPLMGSEYMMEEVMESSTSLAIEEASIRLWLEGNTNGGDWPDASTDWQHVFALDTSSLVNPFLIPCGPTEGCGYPPESVVVDYQDRVLCWWKTKFPALTAQSAFGTSFSLDICGINPSNGNRQVIDNGHLANVIQETDNLYAMTSGGKYLWLRQDFRGTQVIDLSNSTSLHVIAQIRNQDGGYWNANICYFDQNPPWHYRIGPVITGQQSVAGRTAPAIAGSCLFIAETFGIVCIEHDNN